MTSKLAVVRVSHLDSSDQAVVVKGFDNMMNALRRMLAEVELSRFVQSRRRWSCLLVVCLLLGSSVGAQEKKDKEKTGEDKTIASPADGWPLKLTYYRSNNGKDAAVVVLLHMKNESRLVWTAPNGFAEQLHSRGFAVVAVDLRKHGQSKPGAEDDDSKKGASEKDKKKSTSTGDLKPADYQLMVRDMEGIKRFIFEEHQKGNLNMRKMAIVAPTMSAAIAISFASADWQKAPYDDAPTAAARTPRGQDVQAMIFLSPETILPGVLAHQVAPTLKATPMAALVLVGKTDPEKDQAKKLFQLLGGDPSKTAAAKKTTDSKKSAKDKDADKDAEKKTEERLFYAELNTKLRGTDLLGKNLKVEDAMLNFLRDHLQSLKGPAYEWRDRQSRLTE